MTMRRKTIAIAASVVAAVALVVIGAISAGAGPTRHAAPAGHVGKASASAAATVRRSFALFRRAARGKASTADVSTPRLASTGPHGKLYAYMQGSKLCT